MIFLLFYEMRLFSEKGHNFSVCKKIFMRYNCEGEFYKGWDLYDQ